MLGTSISNKVKAKALRLEGKSYSEISDLLSVSKSTLSYWLKSIKLPEQTAAILTEKRLRGAQSGANTRRDEKIKKIEAIEASAAKDVSVISKEQIWLIGIIMYWAEGNKEKPNGRSERVSLSNSDPRLMQIFKYWLTEVLNINESELIYELYIHENSQKKDESLTYWSERLKTDISSFNIYRKRHKVKSRNYKGEYFGLVRIKVRKSSDLNRKISGWIKAIYETFYSRVV